MRLKLKNEEKEKEVAVKEGAAETCSNCGRELKEGTKECPCFWE